MARLISTTVSKTLTLSVITRFSDDTTSVRSFKVGDIVENLRYVDKEEVKTVTGKVTNIVLKSLRSPKTISNTSNPVNTINKDLVPISITIDASNQYESKIVNVNCREIVEDEGVVNVVRVSCVVDLTAKISQKYTDGSVREFDLIPGTWLTDTTIFPGAYYKNSPEITGNFKLVYFVYTVSRNVINITSLCLLKDKKVMYIPIRFIRDIGGISYTDPDEIPEVTVSTTEDFLSALDNIEEGVLTKVVASEDLALTDSIIIEKGKEIILDMGGNKIEVPEPVNNRSIYAINNYGKLTLKNIEISARGIQNLIDSETGEAGELTLEEGVHIIARDTNGGACVWSDGGTVTINEGVVLETTHVGAPTDYTGVGCVHSDGKLIVNGGTFNDVNRRTYAIISNGECIVSDNASITINGAHGAIAIDAGEATINGGVYHSENYYACYISNDNTALMREDALEPRDAKVVINGGDFTGGSVGGYCSVYVGSDIHSPVDSTCAIYGGTFHGKLTVQANVSDDGGIKVYGGKFETKINEDFVAEGYSLSEEPVDGYYVVNVA